MDFKKKFQEHGAGFQMAPMLDIVFILLIHFMAATIFAQWDNKLEIKVPTAANAAENDIRQYGEVILNIDREGKVFINSNEVSDAQLKETRFLRPSPRPSRISRALSAPTATPAASILYMSWISAVAPTCGMSPLPLRSRQRQKTPSPDLTQLWR